MVTARAWYNLTTTDTNQQQLQPKIIKSTLYCLWSHITHHHKHWISMTQLNNESIQEQFKTHTHTQWQKRGKKMGKRSNFFDFENWNDILMLHLHWWRVKHHTELASTQIFEFKFLCLLFGCEILCWKLYIMCIIVYNELLVCTWNNGSILYSLSLQQVSFFFYRS